MIRLDEGKNKADIINSFADLLLTRFFLAWTSPTTMRTRGSTETLLRVCCPFYLQRNFLFLFQGTNASALEKDIGPEQFPINEHYFGLVNVSIQKLLFLIKCLRAFEAT